MAIVTISRELGSGGTEIAERVAEALGAKLVGRELLTAAAQSASMTEQSLGSKERGVGQTSFVSKEMSFLFARERPQEESSLSDVGYVRLMTGVINRAVEEAGRNIVVVGRGSQVVLKDHPEALHVHIRAPLPTRVQAVMRTERVSREKAEMMVATNDREREEYLQRFYRVRWRSPDVYDLMVDTSKLSRDTIVNLLVMAARSLEKSGDTAWQRPSP